MTFIRTIIERSSPTVEIMCEGVIHNDGDGDEADIAAALQRVFDAVPDKTRLILNLSFSGFYDGDVEPPMIAFWIRALVAEGAVVVAAAGNDGGCRKKFPAAMPEVLSVASIGPCCPSPFSNHGPWVDAVRPGRGPRQRVLRPLRRRVRGDRPRLGARHRPVRRMGDVERDVVLHADRGRARSPRSSSCTSAPRARRSTC